MNKIVYANTFATTIAFVWIICTLGIVLFPQMSLTFSSWFMHGMDITRMGAWQTTFGGFIGGGIVLILFAWATGYVFGASLDYFGRKR